MLRMEMEALQDATVTEKTDLPERSSRRQIEVDKKWPLSPCLRTCRHNANIAKWNFQSEFIF
jgi:hypothetical protein